MFYAQQTRKSLKMKTAMKISAWALLDAVLTDPWTLPEETVFKADVSHNGLLDEAVRIPFAWMKSIPRNKLPTSVALENFLLPGNKEDGSDKSRYWNVKK
jgi:hypothetical protein